MMKETLEYFDNEGKVVKKKSRSLGMVEYEDIFRKACNEFEEKRKRANIGRMNVVERVVDEARKVVIEVKMVLAFEYNQRWTYELV